MSKQSIFKLLSLAVFLCCCVILITGAPPALAGYSNMSLFESPTEDACRYCHNDLIRFPKLLYTNVEKHHRLIGTPITKTTAPAGAVLGTTYSCTSCHIISISDPSGGFLLGNFRDCMNCHKVTTVTTQPGTGTNRHHLQGYQCITCHGRGNSR